MAFFPGDKRDFINPNQNTLRSILISSLYNFTPYPRLLPFDRQQKRHGRLIDFLNFPPVNKEGRGGGGDGGRQLSSFRGAAKVADCYPLSFPSFSTDRPPLDFPRRIFSLPGEQKPRYRPVHGDAAASLSRGN